MPDAPRGAPAPLFSHREILTVLSGIVVGLFLAALDQTIVATALPTIAGELKGIAHLSWIVSAYLLASTASAPIYGKLSDLYGRRALLRVAIVIFIVASLLCALAQSMGQLIAARALQGLGGGGLITMAQATVADVMSPRERGRYQGYIAGVWAIASVAGPVLGGLFVDYLNWRWVFWINLPLGLGAVILCHYGLRKLVVRPVKRQIDYLGAALLVPAITALLLVATWGGTELSWGSPVILGLAAGAVVLLVAFALQELRAMEPILPPRLFANPVFRMGNAVSIPTSMAMFGAMLCVPIFLQMVGGASPARSGLLLVPMMFGVTVGAYASGQFIHVTGRYKICPVFGLALASLADLLLATMTAATPLAWSLSYLGTLGIGIGMVMPPILIAVQSSAQAQDLGAATSAVSFFRSLGGSFGAAVLWSALLAAMSHYLGIAAAAGTQGLSLDFLHGGPEAIAALPPATREAVLAALTQAFHVVFLLGAGLTALSCGLAIFLKEMPLRATGALARRAEPASRPTDIAAD